MCLKEENDVWMNYHSVDRLEGQGCHGFFSDTNYILTRRITRKFMFMLKGHLRNIIWIEKLPPYGRLFLSPAEAFGCIVGALSAQRLGPSGPAESVEIFFRIFCGNTFVKFCGNLFGQFFGNEFEIFCGYLFRKFVVKVFFRNFFLGIFFFG